MLKPFHEVRDPIHVFVRFDGIERDVINSRPFQRLRHIHQLALSYLVYPGATHRRFEHSLGVMELASRVFDVVTAREALSDDVLDLLPADAVNDDSRRYWRRVVRMAALCHDMGHLPFSHAAEKELLPAGFTHEHLTRAIITSQEMEQIWGAMTPPLRSLDVVKVALGPREAPDLHFSNWETILAEIIVGSAFGVDRMDYLLRDSHHTGVSYGRFDHYRLIDTLRILVQPTVGGGEADGDENAEAEPVPSLGVEEGGVQSAEALLLARYFMFSQVYLHPVRRVYDIHLKDFLAQWLPGGRFSTDVEELLRMTDNEVTAAFRLAALDADAPGHDAARRILQRDHFRVLYEWNPDDVRVNPEAGCAIAEAASEKFGADWVRHDPVPPKDTSLDFPVRMRDDRVVSALALSRNIAHIPPAAVDYVFVAPTIRRRANDWLTKKRQEIITPKSETENG